jgi:hypothetical protein
VHNCAADCAADTWKKRGDQVGVKRVTYNSTRVSGWPEPFNFLCLGAYSVKIIRISLNILMSGECIYETTVITTYSIPQHPKLKHKTNTVAFFRNNGRLQPVILA